MLKKYKDINVYDATQERLEFIFKEFDNILVAFSGGKDSGLLLNLVLKYAEKNNVLNKLSVYHLDYEAQYQQTTDYVDIVYASLPQEVKKYWLCLPIKAQCSTSMFQSFWNPWNKKEKDIWVRKMPNYSYIINEENAQFDYQDWDYKVQDNFCFWIGKQAKTCVLIGIRTQESLHRQSAISSKTKVNQYKKSNYLTTRNNIVIGYPIYDWLVKDIWLANYKYDFNYNKLYDLMYLAGLTISQMRVASPFNDYAKSSLHIYKALDPNNWGKMLGRVNGVNFTSIYGDTSVMGWKNITKPSNFTWKDYMYFLLETLPEKTKNNYLKKIKASKDSWKTGGARDKKTIEELIEEKAPVILTGKTNNRGFKQKQVICFNDYLDDTNVSDFKAIPTYKRICICIMKNDHQCKYMGFAPTKEESIKKMEVLKKYANLN